ncbi:MAG TPA: glycosyltransferase family 4 protein [Anaerolineales bacterium]|nr:glycosyltransferase family 4 protein [Anaerolineales bacterium]
MKIVLLHYSAPPIVGGVESVIGHHARMMADAGHEVRIVAGRGGQTDERVEFMQIPEVDSRHPLAASLKEQLDAGRVPAEFSTRVEELTRTLLDVVSDADCLIAHNVCSLNKNLVLTAALKEISEQAEQTQMILWHHDLAWTTPRYQNELHEGYPWDLLRTAWPCVKQVTISEFRQKELADLMGIAEDDIHVVPNGVDVPRFLKLEPLTSGFVSQLDLLKACPILLLPVRITPRKNIELALHVLAALRETYPQAVLVVTGPLGPHNPSNVDYFKKLQSLRETLSLQQSAFFLAELTDMYLPDEVISDFYQIADALILPSREEGFGIPVLEAGLAGLPAFCADIPPLRDLGMAAVRYFSLDDSPAHIASLIAEQMSSSSILELRARVRSHFAWPEIYRQQIDPLLRKVDK